MHGSEGSAVLEEEDIKHWDFAKAAQRGQAILAADGRAARAPAAARATRRPSATTATRCSSSDFVDAIRKNRAPAIDGHEGRRRVEIILAIYKAAETGQSGQAAAAGEPVHRSMAARKKG